MAHPKLDIKLLVRYYGLKATQYFTKFTSESATVLREDLVTMKLPLPKRENMTFLSHGHVECFWPDVPENKVLHNNVRHKCDPPADIKAQLSISKITLKEIYAGQNPKKNERKRPNPSTEIYLKKRPAPPTVAGPSAPWFSTSFEDINPQRPQKIPRLDYDHTSFSWSSQGRPGPDITAAGWGQPWSINETPLGRRESTSSVSSQHLPAKPVDWRTVSTSSVPSQPLPAIPVDWRTVPMSSVSSQHLPAKPVPVGRRVSTSSLSSQHLPTKPVDPVGFHSRSETIKTPAMKPVLPSGPGATAGSNPPRIVKEEPSEISLSALKPKSPGPIVSQKQGGNNVPNPPNTVASQRPPPLTQSHDPRSLKSQETPIQHNSREMQVETTQSNRQNVASTQNSFVEQKAQSSKSALNATPPVQSREIKIESPRVQREIRPVPPTQASQQDQVPPSPIPNDAKRGEVLVQDFLESLKLKKKISNATTDHSHQTTDSLQKPNVPAKDIQQERSPIPWDTVAAALHTASLNVAQTTASSLSTPQNNGQERPQQTIKGPASILPTPPPSAPSVPSSNFASAVPYKSLPTIASSSVPSLSTPHDDRKQAIDKEHAQPKNQSLGSVPLTPRTTASAPPAPPSASAHPTIASSVPSSSTPQDHRKQAIDKEHAQPKNQSLNPVPLTSRTTASAPPPPLPPPSALAHPTAQARSNAGSAQPQSHQRIISTTKADRDTGPEMGKKGGSQPHTSNHTESNAAAIQRLTREAWDIKRGITAQVARETAIIAELKALKSAWLPDPVKLGFDPSEDMKDNLKRVEDELERERKLRQEAEDAIRDVRRECKTPFVVPSLLDAFVEISKLTTRATRLSSSAVGVDAHLIVMQPPITKPETSVVSGDVGVPEEAMSISDDDGWYV